MSARNPRYELPTWVAGLVIALAAATLGYVFVYGGDPSGPVALLLGAFGVGLSLFTVYLLYRFVVAVEEIADKH